MKIASGCSWAAVVAVALWSNPGLAEESDTAKNLEQSENPSSYIRDYLSDPRRTGSLAGSILGGALVAHPAGSVVGSVIGFFVGKRTLFNEDKVRAERAKTQYARRDIAPNADQGIPTLSLSNARGITFDESNSAPSAFAASSGATTAFAQGTKPAAAPLAVSRDQIAEKCSTQARADPRLRSLCFYYQGS